MIEATCYTLGDLLYRYERDALPQYAPRTQYHYSLLYRSLRARYGALPLGELTPTFVRQWRDELRTRYQPRTVRVYMATLGSALTAAVEEYAWLESNPMRTVRKPPEPPARVRFLDDTERAHLLHACQHSSNPYLYTIVMIALTTGARKNEVCQLQWSAVDVHRGLLSLARTKNKTRRSVPLMGEALTLLRQQAQTSRSLWVFPQGDGTKGVWIDRVFHQAVMRAGIVDFRFHDIRHTAASYLAMSGASLRDIAEILGHRNIQQTMIYAHLVESHTRGVVERMVHRFLRPPEPPAL